MHERVCVFLRVNVCVYTLCSPGLVHRFSGEGIWKTIGETAKRKPAESV